MNMLIIGGAGYIGGVTAHLAKKAGHTVTIVDDLSTGNDYNIPAGATFINADIRRRDAARNIFALPCDAVIHLAARILVPESMQQPYTYFDTNTHGVLNVVDAAATAGVKNYILSSTAAVYGAPVHIPLQESDPTSPVNPYGASKLLAEQLLASYAITHHLNWVALRYFNVAGAYDGVGTDYPFVSHIIPSFLEQMRSKKPIRINGNDYDTPDGTAIRDYVHVVDIARAHLLAAEKLGAGTICQPINLGSHNGFSVKQVAETFNKVTGADLPIEYHPRRAGDPPKLIASNERAKKLLDWQPEYELETIIRDHYQWFKTQSRRKR
ncbi:MAG TPA: UDP-glucose 4-epimerase GalE [Magnetospirillaceae bacterium]|nr:UDP-glucose 4-epimerase GalE [Magnetospirillaceae bacterium]